MACKQVLTLLRNNHEGLIPNTIRQELYCVKSASLQIWRSWIRIPTDAGARLFPFSFYSDYHNRIESPKSGSSRRCIYNHEVKLKWIPGAGRAHGLHWRFSQVALDYQSCQDSATTLPLLRVRTKALTLRGLC